MTIETAGRRRASPRIARRHGPWAAAAAILLLLAGCGETDKGPLLVSAIGGPPALVNPNLRPLDAASAFLVEATAQGLVRFEGSGQIEAALAQRWIVSDDGLRYTFRLAPASWTGGGKASAAQVVERLRAAGGAASRNPLKPLLGAIDEIVAMTDDVLEISLKSPRPNFLQLLAQPELGILYKGRGSGPYLAEKHEQDAVRLRPIVAQGGDEPGEEEQIILRGERAARAIVRFGAGDADFVTGGTAGDLPIARAAEPPPQALRFDPVDGLFGLAFVAENGPFGSAEARRAIAMAIDRAALAAALAVPDLQPRETLWPAGIEGLPSPTPPAWSAAPLAARRAEAAAIIGRLTQGVPPTLRIALPLGPGYRLVFAHLKRDLRTIGVSAEAVPREAAADVRLIDQIAPATMASWYLRRFACASSKVCNREADSMMAAARIAATPAERSDRLREADRLLGEAAVYVPLTAPVRWHLVSNRLTGFRPNIFGRHPAGELIAER